MISVYYDTANDFGFKEFPNTTKGNRDSIQYIKGLYEERKKHPWFFNMEKIKRVKDKLDDNRLGRKTKKRYQLESELNRLNEERTKLLNDTGTTEKPKEIIISITHQK